MMNNKSANKPKGLNNYPDPLWRRLTVYAFDPSLGRQLNNYMTINVPYEELLEGPIGRKLAVIDYDVSNDRYYEAVDLDHPAVTLRNGLEPSESRPPIPPADGLRCRQRNNPAFRIRIRTIHQMASPRQR